MKVSIIKMKSTICIKGESKKQLWAIVGEHGGTMLQVYSEKYPTDWERFFNLPIKK